MQSETKSKVLEKINIDKIWSTVRVGFCLLTHGDKQFIAYYNNARRMVVGVRNLGDKKFNLSIIPSKSENPPTRQTSSTIQGWDSHNYIRMAVDKEGYLHLAGNMHANPLTYFRSEKPLDPATLKQLPMVGNREKRCTYPKFMQSPDGELLFHYRDGGSGKGDEIYNIYDVKTKTWRRFLKKPFISGLGKCNAYQNGPRLGPDGWYHLNWVWRDTPDAATNHDLSYAKSKDLINWVTAGGEKLPKPITPKDTATIVDPIPVKGGIINGCNKMGFDSKGRVVLAYHKHDKNGDTQAYAARFVDGKWLIKQISDWKGKHIFKGGGSGPSKFGTSIRLGKISNVGNGQLGLYFKHWKAGRGILVFDEETLKPIRIDPEPEKFPEEVMKMNSKFSGMGIRIAGDSGTSPDSKVKYILKWESMPPNRDRPRDKPWPEDSDLILYKLSVPKGK